jgi:hypothetical protein
LEALPRPDFTRGRLVPPKPAPGCRANQFVPEGHTRYAELVKWAATADPIWWRYGTSSEGKPGLWVSYDVWDRRPAGLRPLSKIATPVSLALSESTRRAMGLPVDEAEPQHDEQWEQVG